MIILSVTVMWFIIEQVDAIFLHLEGEESTAVIWFDLFSNNQHGLDEPPPFEWWCHTFLNAIKTINRTVMIIEPWEDPTPLTRAWFVGYVYTCILLTDSLPLFIGACGSYFALQRPRADLK